jgi:hypothetical protein
MPNDEIKVTDDALNEFEKIYLEKLVEIEEKMQQISSNFDYDLDKIDEKHTNLNKTLENKLIIIKKKFDKHK